MPMLGESGYARKALDLYCTEPWVTNWALDCGFKPNAGKVVWECACGLGHISKVLKHRGFTVLSTDVFDHGYAEIDGVKDFMSVDEVDPSIDLIMSNPPYDIKDTAGVPDVTAEQFVRHAIRLMEPNRGAVLMLLRHDFDTAAGRISLFEQRPFAAKMTLTKRPSWILPTEQRSQGTKDAPRFPYSWYYWDWDYMGEPQMHWLPKRERL